MRQNDSEDEFDHSFLRWGPDGTLGADDLDRAIDEDLVGRRDCDIGVRLEDDDRTLVSLWYEKADLDTLDAFEEKGLLCTEHRFGSEVLALMRRHPLAKADAAIECTYGEDGWLCVIRRIDLYAKEVATDEDVACAQDIARTLMGSDADGNWRSQSVNVLWFEKGMIASSYDWRGSTRKELPHAHEMNLPKREGRH